MNQNPLLKRWSFLIALAVNIYLALIFFVEGWLQIKHNTFWVADFTGFYTSGEMVRDGLGKQLYNIAIQKSYQQNILAGHGFHNIPFLIFISPPHNALIFAGLARFSLPAAYAVQIGIQFILLAGLILTLRNFTRLWKPQERILMITGVLAFYPLLRTFYLGSFSLLVLLCFLLWADALKKRKPIKAGLLLLPASLRPQTAVLPALTLLFGKRWRSVVTVFIGCIVIVLFAALWLGPGIWLDFAKALQKTSTYFDKYSVCPSNMYNLKGTLTIWLGNEHATLINIISLFGFIFSIAATWWLWRGKWQPEQPSFNLRLSLTLTLGVLFGIYVNPQDGLLLVAPAVLFYEYLRRARLPRRAYGIFLWLCPLAFLLNPILQKRLGIRLPVIAMLVLIVWQFWALWRIAPNKETDMRPTIEGVG